jgi:hypothetical protein
MASAKRISRKKKKKKKQPPKKITIARLRATCPDLRDYSDIVLLGYRTLGKALDGQVPPEIPEYCHDFENDQDAAALVAWFAENMKRKLV